MNYKILNGQAILDRYRKMISGLRTGRVNSSILDSIKVEAYGTKMSFTEIATITTPEPGQLMITPFDKSLIRNITTAILNSDLGVNPSDDGAGVRLIFPPMTEEDKKQRVKTLLKLKEEARKDIRVHRQDALKKQKNLKDAGEISEDELKSFEKNLQLEVDNLNLEIDNITKQKEQDIMKI
jgi:ribosome recycling factor